MARILFEDEILHQEVNELDQLQTNEETKVKEDPTDEDIYSSNESQASVMYNPMKIIRRKSIITENVIYLGSKVDTENDASKEQNGNNSQDNDNTPQDKGNTSHGEGKTPQDEGITSEDEGNTSQEEDNSSQGENNQSKDESNSSQVEGNMAQAEVFEVTITPLTVDKPKGKRRIKRELEMLLLDLKKNDEDLNDLDEQYDVFGHDDSIFRKYKLRKIQQTVSYKEPEDIKLKECRRRFSRETELDLTCPVCKHVLENKVALLNHIRIHNIGALDYTCSLCSKKFERKADLIAHRQIHSGESFLCQTCKLAFSSFSDYLLHNYEHIDQPHFKCSECGLRYRKSVYKKHIMTHFEKKLSCNLCPFVANGSHHLQTHTNQHNNKFACIECGKVCNRKSDFDYHMSVHTGVKKAQCHYCGACFRSNHARDVHHRIHTGEKPFKCDICGYSARQWTDLKRHKETHITEKKYTCDCCGKKYMHKEYLVVHMRSHTKKSLYECTECDAKFVSVNGLKTHSLFKHTSERPVECTLCDKKFINENQYRKHCRAKYHLRNVYGNNMSANTKK